MSELATSPWEIIDRIYGLFTTYPASFLAVVVVGFQRGLHVHISPWIALLTLVASVGIVIGILLAYF